MRVGALIFGILGGLIALSYGLLGYGLGSLADAGQSGAGSGMKLISLGIPIGALLGAGMVIAAPVFGASLMAIAAVSLVLILGFNIFSLVPVVLLGLGALLGFSGAAQEDKKQSSNLGVDRIKSTKASSASPTDTPVSPVARYDQSKWNALLKYDNDIASIADKIRPFGQKWLDEFASSYLALNDKQYLPEIEHKITAAATREKEEKEQAALAAAKAEAERIEQIRILAEKQKKAYEEQQKARLQEQERRSQARKEQFKLWQNWIIKNSKILAIGGVSVIFVGVIVTAVLWQRNIKIEEEVRLAEERSQERIAKEQVEERARIAEERQKIDEAHRRTDQKKTEIPKSALPVTSISTPVVQVGDSYTYESIDADNPGPSITTKRTITSNSDKIILSVLNISSSNAKPRNLYFTNEWNLIGTRNADNSGLDYSPPLKYFDFPLYPGKAWQQTTTETNVKTQAIRIHKISGTVGQWEDVSVPAGTFHAIKVNLQTEVYDPTTAEKINGTDTSWYVPEIRRSVKSLTTGKDAKKQLIQLVQYEFAASAKKVNAKVAVSCVMRSECVYFSDLYEGDTLFRNALISELKNTGINKIWWIPSGVNTVMTPISIGGITYLVGSICEPHNCGTHNISVLYLPDQNHLVGRYKPENGKFKWIGTPTPQEQKVILNYENGDSFLRKALDSNNPLPVHID